jgi:uncharacterized protein (DUF983 family)
MALHSIFSQIAAWRTIRRGAVVNAPSCGSGAAIKRFVTIELSLDVKTVKLL